MTKNPFFRNITWLAALSFLSLICVIIKYYFCENPSDLIDILNNLILSIFSSSVLLLLNETIQYFFDQKLYGFLNGQYERTIITNVIENNLVLKNKNREEEITTSEERKKLQSHGLRAIEGSRYLELEDYKKLGKDWKIELKYLHNGIYEGEGEYNKYWKNSGESTKVKFTLTLDKNNILIGNGSYKYLEVDDYGIYHFQVNADDKSEILVTYKNTIPNGLAEGYEKWKKL